MPAIKKTTRPVVPPAEGMNLMTLRKHVGLRHRYTMRFITTNEHAADHRLHDSMLDHTHRGEEQEDGGEPTG